jgi:uncharacterized membrane-anchored protein
MEGQMSPAFYRLLRVLLAAGLIAAPSVALADPAREAAALHWQKGPTEAQLGSTATLKVPDGMMFLDSADTRRFLELTGNPPRDNNYTLAPADHTWFAIFRFDSRGYVKDDEKLDPDALLKALQDGDARGNQERGRLKMTPLYTDGWHVPPHYDPQTKRLEWGVRLRTDQGDKIVNYTVRILGRRGVMQAILVSDPQQLDRDMVTFKAALQGYDFAAGQRYAEFRAGDHVAEYGLAALVVGGAAAAAAKTGAGKALFKMLIYGGIAAFGAVGAALKKLFGRPQAPAAKVEG